MSRNRFLRNYLVPYLTILATSLTFFSRLREVIDSEFVQGIILGFLLCLIIVSLFIDIAGYFKGGRRYEEI